MREADLLADEARYCSFGDTVHYVQPPKIFERCEGSYLFDGRGVPYLDLQMWYSAVNFGYANPRLNDVMKRQLDTLPQVASQYLHRGKIALSKTIADPNLYAKDRAAFDRASAALGKAQAELAQAEDDWLRLEELREQVEAR